MSYKQEECFSRPYVITPSMGKRLIGMAMAAHPAVQSVLNKGTLVIVAGTTNGYVAEEIFKARGENGDFHREGFFRGVTVPAKVKTTDMGMLAGTQHFPGDVVIVDGKWMEGATIFDVVDELDEGDLILKGANALDLSRQQAAILIGHPKSGTIGAAMLAVAGRRVGIILPVGLEKRVDVDLYELALRLNAPGRTGPRLLPVPASVFTEIEAIRLLSGAKVEIIAAGGVYGAEGSVWISVHGSPDECNKAEDVLSTISLERDFASGLE